MPGAFPDSPPPSPLPSPSPAASLQLAETIPAASPCPPMTTKPRRKKTKRKQDRPQSPVAAVTAEEVTSAPSSVVVPARTDFTPVAPARIATGGFDFGRDMPALRCRLRRCPKQTSPTDGTSVACPACGFLSLVRYCSKEHLYEDLRHHFSWHCGKYPVGGRIDHSTVAPVRARQPRPYLRNAQVQTLEHHRQAVYFAMEGINDGDYFVFADAAALDPVEIPTEEQIANCRGMGGLVARIKLADPEDINDHRQQRFRRLITHRLAYGALDEEGRKECVALAAMIRQELINQNQWDEDMITYLAMSMKQEFGFQLPEVMMQ